MAAERAMSDSQGSGAVYEALQQKAASELGEDEVQSSSLFSGLESLVVGGLAIGALALCSYNVAVRFFHPAWTLELSDEVQVYLIIWAVMISLGSVTLADRHVKADLFVSFFPPRVRHALEVFGDLLGLGFALLLLWCGVLIAYDSWDFGEVSTTSLRFPLWIFVSALPAGALMLAVGYATRLLRRRRKES
jgi:C4-dicarboxylate transporter DctQ subunit